MKGMSSEHHCHQNGERDLTLITQDSTEALALGVLVLVQVVLLTIMKQDWAHPTWETPRRVSHQTPRILESGSAKEQT